METSHAYGIKRFDIFKMSVLPKVIYKFNEIPIKIPIMFFAEMENPILKFIWNIKGLQTAKTILKKEEQNWRAHTS